MEIGRQFCKLLNSDKMLSTHTKKYLILHLVLHAPWWKRSTVFSRLVPFYINLPDIRSEIRSRGPPRSPILKSGRKLGVEMVSISLEKNRKIIVVFKKKIWQIVQKLPADALAQQQR